MHIARAAATVPFCRRVPNMTQGFLVVQPGSNPSLQQHFGTHILAGTYVSWGYSRVANFQSERRVGGSRGMEHVDAEALRRVTELRLQMLQDRVRAEQDNAGQQQQLAAKHEMQAQIHAQMQANTQQEHLRHALEAKRQQLRQLDETTQQMRAQLALRQAEGGRGGERRGEGEGASKLDAILAQTLQMQAMFMAHMSAPGMGRGYGAEWGANSGPMPHGGVPGGHGGSSMMGQPNPQRQNVHGQSPEDVEAPTRPQQPAVMPQGAGGYAPEQDIALLSQLQGVAEKLNRADTEAHAVAEAALERARAQDTARDAGGPSPKKGRPGETTEDEGKESEDEIEEGDEITHEEMATFHDIAFSWLKKVVKHVIINVLLEADINFGVCAPYKGSFFKKGVTQQEIDSRVIKLSVRCKGLIKALREAFTPQETPDAIISFMHRLVAHKQKYPGAKVGGEMAGLNGGAANTARPGGGGSGAADKQAQHNHIFQRDGSYLSPTEREMLKLTEDVDRAGEINEAQARFLMAHFLFGRILIKQLVLEPWKHAVGPRTQPSATTAGSLQVLAFMMYRGLTAGFHTSAGPTQEVSIFECIGSLPGDESYLSNVTLDLQAVLKVRECVSHSKMCMSVLHSNMCMSVLYSMMCRSVLHSQHVHALGSIQYAITLASLVPLYSSLYSSTHPSSSY